MNMRKARRVVRLVKEIDHCNLVICPRALHDAIKAKAQSLGIPVYKYVKIPNCFERKRVKNENLGMHG